MVMEDPAEQLSPRNLASRETFARKGMLEQSQGDNTVDNIIGSVPDLNNYK